MIYKKFFNEIFEEGERTGIKVNPDTVAKTMRRARNENNERVFQVSELLTSQQVASYFSTKKYANPKRRLSSAGCLFHMCEIPAKFENNGFSKYSKGTSTWRKRQEKGLCYSSSLEACLWLSALSNSQRLLEEAWTYNYEGLRVLYFPSTINFGVSLEGWHLEFQYLNSDVLN